MRYSTTVVTITFICLLTTAATGLIAGEMGRAFPFVVVGGMLFVIPSLTVFVKLFRLKSGQTSDISIPLVVYLTVIFATMLNLSQEGSVSLEGGNSIMSLARLALRLAINAAVIAWYVAKDRPFSDAIRRWQILLTIFAGITFLSVPLSNDLLYSLGRWLDVFLFLFASAVLVGQANISSSRIMMSAFVSLSLVVAGLWGWWLVDPDPLTRVIYLSTSTGENNLEMGRFGGNVVPPGVMGFTGSALTLLAVHAFRSANRSLRIWAIVAGALGLLTVIRSDARTVMIALMISVLWILASRFGGKDGTYSALSFLWLGSTGYLAWLMTNVGTAVLSRHTNDTSLTTLTGRTELWNDIIGVFFKRPEWWLFGAGFNTLGGRFQMGALSTDSAHNGYLHMLVGTGVLGIAVYFAVFSGAMAASLSAPDPLIRSSLISLMMLIIIHNFAELGAFVMMSPATLLGSVTATAAVRAREAPLSTRLLDLSASDASASGMASLSKAARLPHVQRYPIPGKAPEL